MTEEWRPVLGYEGDYEVSNLGRVRSVDRLIHYAGSNGKPAHSKRRKGVILSQQLTNSGYYMVGLKKGGERKYNVHRIVAFAFHPLFDECVNHKDGNRLNNRADNLEWCSYSENSTHAWKMKKTNALKSKETV